MAKRLSDADRPRYVLYFRGHRPPDQYPRNWVPIYWDLGQAHGLILKFLGSAEYTRDGNTLTLPDPEFRLTAAELDAILASEPVAPPEDVARTMLRFKLGTWEQDHSKPPEEEAETTTEDGKVKVEKVKAPKPEKPSKAKPPEGWVSIGEWAKKWGITPMEARAALRGSGLTKPDFGWSFDPKDEKKIKKICGVKS